MLKRGLGLDLRLKIRTRQLTGCLGSLLETLVEVVLYLHQDQKDIHNPAGYQVFSLASVFDGMQCRMYVRLLMLDLVLVESQPLRHGGQCAERGIYHALMHDLYQQ